MKSNFSKKLLAEGVDKEFNFMLVDYGSSSESIYHVTVLDNEGKYIIFRMKQSERGLWSIQAQALPIWLFEIELKLSDAIEENIG